MAKGAVMAQQQSGITHVLDVIKAEYREMPCLSLTKPQMQRLWGLEPFVCDAVIDALVTGRVLRKTANGMYVAMGYWH
jgi:hypothetical protein